MAERRRAAAPPSVTESLLPQAGLPPTTRLQPGESLECTAFAQNGWSAAGVEVAAGELESFTRQVEKIDDASQLVAVGLANTVTCTGPSYLYLFANDSRFAYRNRAAIELIMLAEWPQRAQPSGKKQPKPVEQQSCAHAEEPGRIICGLRDRPPPYGHCFFIALQGSDVFN